MHFTKQQALNIGKKFGVNFNIIPLKMWHKALEIEAEHSNITHGSILTTAKIALAHLMEYPDYYKRLVKMEKQAEKYWSDKEKPSIFND